jgi:hypothetical protein
VCGDALVVLGLVPAEQRLPVGEADEHRAPEGPLALQDPHRVVDRDALAAVARKTSSKPAR